MLPTLVELTFQTALTFHDTEAIPAPDQWTPSEDPHVDPIEPALLRAEIGSFKTFQVTTG